jgi:restriction endonuclease S subunit
LLEEERVAVINQAVTKGLDPNVSMKDSGIEWLGKIPEHWEVKRLRNIVDTIKTGSTPPSDEIKYFEPQEINWYGPGDFDKLKLGDAKRKISQLAIEQNKCRLFPSNSILLIGIGATVGKVGLSTEPCSSNQQINAIILKEFYNARFYLYFLSTIKEIIVMEASSATLPIFNQTQTKNISVSVPPIEEQNKIVDFIEIQMERVQTIIEKSKHEIELLKEYKTALISEVVTGKVDVRNEKLN